MNGQLMPGMSSAEDLQAAGDYDEASPTGMGEASGAEPLVVCLEVTPDGQISVYDKAGAVEPTPVQSLEEGLQALGELATELSQRMAVKAMKAREGEAKMARPGNAEAQAMWDQMAAERQPRGNT